MVNRNCNNSLAMKNVLFRNKNLYLMVVFRKMVVLGQRFEIIIYINERKKKPKFGIIGGAIP